MINMDRELAHHGILGQKWGVRRYQNKDGTLTPAGKLRYGVTGQEIAEAISKTFDNGKVRNRKEMDEYYDKVKELEENERVTEIASNVKNLVEYRDSIWGVYEEVDPSDFPRDFRGKTFKTMGDMFAACQETEKQIYKNITNYIDEWLGAFGDVRINESFYNRAVNPNVRDFVSAAAFRRARDLNYS